MAVAHHNFISALFFSALCFSFANTTNDPYTDQLALLEIKAGIVADPFGVLTSWNETIHFCSWHGVTCGRRHQRVTILDLQSLSLAGSVSPHVGNLSFLRQIYLQNNSFSHEIPPEIGHLRRLQNLRLDNNSLTGEIPTNLSHCSQLITIVVAYNSLVGKIPGELGALSKLRVIAIHDNHLTGSVPNSFTNLSSLRTLSATDNHLSGSIPNIFPRMTNLYFVSFGSNNLSGTIPPSIFNLSSITIISMSGNKLRGTLPANLGMASPSLQHFGISSNQISGPIPPSVSNATNLVGFTAAENQLLGKVPSLKKLQRLTFLVVADNQLGNGAVGDLAFLCDLVNATNLRILQFYTNHFGGTLPQCIGNLSSSLVMFHASENQILGSIPNEIANLVNLEAIWLSDNKLSGHIPTGFGMFQKLYSLNMSWNSLSGNVPSSFRNLTRLSELYLHSNNLEGKIPLESQNLMVLSLGANNFSGNIPGEIVGLWSLYFLSLSQNHLTGSIPEDVGKLTNLEHLDMSRNMLTGEIPATIGSCIKLEYLDMHGNFLQGKIPSSLGSLRGVKELYLSENNLFGSIPQFLEHLQVLQSLNLSYNNFEGIVPMEGVFKNVTATSVEGNTQLCGGIPEFHLPKCKLQHSNKGGLSSTMKVVISLFCSILGLTSALAILYLCCSRREHKERASSDSEKFPHVSYQNLLKATDGFSPANLIGKGSFGSVYKGVLEQSGATVAIKVLNLLHHGAYKSFTAECEALKNIRHRNLVKVISACSGSDYQGHDFKALIYEFMVNGSLEEWLHPMRLTFSQRLNIVFDVAAALDYLHYQCETPIVHCDLKPGNVLLDDDMIGHVGDFGLARFLPKAAENNSSPNQSSSFGAKGSIGYIPPEYGMGHEVWTQGDVYSYGVLVLEIFTGKRPTNDMFEGSSNLRSFVKTALPKKVVEIVDPVLFQENVKGHNGKITGNEENIAESLISILEIGVACSAELPRERLDISDVVTQMSRIRNKHNVQHC